MTKLIYGMALSLFVISCSNDDVLEPQLLDNQELLSRVDINKIIDNSLQTTENFDWSKEDASVIFSAVKLGEGILPLVMAPL